MITISLRWHAAIVFSTLRFRRAGGLRRHTVVFALTAGVEVDQPVRIARTILLIFRISPDHNGLVGDRQTIGFGGPVIVAKLVVGYDVSIHWMDLRQPSVPELAASLGVGCEDSAGIQDTVGQLTVIELIYPSADIVSTNPINLT